MTRDLLGVREMPVLLEQALGLGSYVVALNKRVGFAARSCLPALPDPQDALVQAEYSAAILKEAAEKMWMLEEGERANYEKRMKKNQTTPC